MCVSPGSFEDPCRSSPNLPSGSEALWTLVEDGVMTLLILSYQARDVVLTLCRGPCLRLSPAPELIKSWCWDKKKKKGGEAGVRV